MEAAYGEPAGHRGLYASGGEARPVGQCKVVLSAGRSSDECKEGNLHTKWQKVCSTITRLNNYSRFSLDICSKMRNFAA